MAKEIKEYRLVRKYGRVFAEVRYRGMDYWTNWLFATSETPKKYWKFVPEVGLYVSNVSWG